MILRADTVGEHPSVRFVIRNMENNEMWNGKEFTNDFKTAVKYAHPSDACGDMQEILKDHYGHLPHRRFVVPVEIEVYGNVPEREVAEYLYRASVLSIRTDEYGNGPDECLVLPVIHWGFIKKLKHSVLDKRFRPDNPAAEWGLEEDTNENE